MFLHFFKKNISFKKVKKFQFTKENSKNFFKQTITKNFYNLFFFLKILLTKQTKASGKNLVYAILGQNIFFSRVIEFVSFNFLLCVIIFWEKCTLHFKFYVIICLNFNKINYMS